MAETAALTAGHALRGRPALYAALATALAFSALDATWLGFASGDTYIRDIGAIMLPSPRWDAAILFYFVYLAGTLIFVVLPHGSKGIAATAIRGALFGFVAYSTYDLTNLATLEAFTWRLSLIDMAWGTTATALASAAGAAAARLG
jgi:uncharacterized membrane protein